MFWRIIALLGCLVSAHAADWQWSVPSDKGRAFLWIPPSCQRVRAVMVGQHNMIEEGIFENQSMRATLEGLGIAEVWIAPPVDSAFDFNQGAGERFEALMSALAQASGYAELRFAPAIPIGHSACATFPWNFGAWSPNRTLAMISVHGDAPQTSLTGYGRANVDWGNRSIDGVPGLMVMGEYEWLDARLEPASAFRARHPLAPIAVLAEPGRGHFDTSEDLIGFLEMFIAKAVAARLPIDAPLNQAPTLRPVNPRDGWLVGRWYLDKPRETPPAPFAFYTGNKAEAFWAFDREMAEATQHYRSNQIGKKPQLLAYIQDHGVVAQTATHQQVNLKFEPFGDGLTFALTATNLPAVAGGSPRLTHWTGLPVGAPLGHPSGGGPIRLSLITGPAVQIGESLFRVELNRTASTTDRRENEIWILAEQNGDAVYKSAVQQSLMHLPRNHTGTEQHLTFAPIGDQVDSNRSKISLVARSDAGLPVGFYVREGPAELAGDQLMLTPIPPRAKLPVKVTIVAYQLGRAGESPIREAAAVEQTFLVTRTGEPSTPGVDSIQFGDPTSESAHALTAERSETIAGALGEPARRLLPRGKTAWEGGSVFFTLRVDPVRANYATARFWGSDVSSECLTLFCEGKQIGYRQGGDVDLLDNGDEEGPGCAGRFFYSTRPLPLAMTRGKTELHFEIRASGGMWPYGSTFASYQHAMTEPSRGIYALSIHTDGYFTPSAADKQGHAALNPPVRTEPGLEEMRALALRVNGEIKHLIASRDPLGQMQNEFLARAWLQPWTAAYRSPEALKRVWDSLDATYRKYVRNPHLAASDPATPNADWFGLGPSGDVIRLLAKQLEPDLDAMIPDGKGGAISRRNAYAQMLFDCREWHQRHRRLYSNQTMINDLYGIYLANRGLEVVDPARAMSESQVRRYLYESVGLEAWRNSDPGAPDGPPETGGKRWAVGPNYWELTTKGLTRELGYVGYYGEVLDWVTLIYNATRPTPEQPGDEKIRQQLVRIEKARAIFRYPDVDDEGYRAMRIEAVVGWRDPNHYPGDVCYGERTTWDGSALFAASSTLDPYGLGYARQMLDDNQFFASVRERLKDKGFRVTAGLLDYPGDYARVLQAPASPTRLPMSPGQPDFIFSDEEDGVVAIKEGSHIFYASLYWRAHRGVNGLARIHDLTPEFDRIAVVREDVVVDPSGLTYVRPDEAVTPSGGLRYPEKIHSALAGEKMPIAKIPPGVDFKPGDESVYAGKASFYTLRYGHFLIGMNMDAARTFILDAPDGPRSVSPRTTVVVKMP